MKFEQVFKANKYRALDGRFTSKENHGKPFKAEEKEHPKVRRLREVLLGVKQKP